MGRNLIKWAGCMTTLLILNSHLSFSQKQTDSVKGAVKTTDDKPASLLQEVTITSGSLLGTGGWHLLSWIALSIPLAIIARKIMGNSHLK